MLASNCCSRRTKNQSSNLEARAVLLRYQHRCFLLSIRGVTRLEFLQATCQQGSQRNLDGINQSPFIKSSIFQSFSPYNFMAENELWIIHKNKSFIKPTCGTLFTS